MATLVEIQDFLKRYDKNFRFAKTYAKTFPHEYLVFKDVEPKDRYMFKEFAEFIREKGFKKKFFKKDFHYFIVDGFKYWTMDEDVSETKVINREPINEK
ncbi:MAG: hypothetical protein J7L23_02310 [Candidatus Diapherotrites archaeon]|nr:hypothetical protein [Candidatus Diapherotrites archaeon]